MGERVFGDRAACSPSRGAQLPRLAGGASRSRL